MNRRQGRGLSREEQRIFVRIVVLAVFLALLWLLFAPGLGLISYRRASHRVEDLQKRIRTLERQNAELEEEIDRLEHDDAYLEKLAREKYGMLKENEEVFIFPSKKKGRK